MDIRRHDRINGASLPFSHGNAHSRGLEHRAVVVPVAEGEDAVRPEFRYLFFFLHIVVFSGEDMIPIIEKSFFRW
jgi:hypothetical protein